MLRSPTPTAQEAMDFRSPELPEGYEGTFWSFTVRHSAELDRSRVDQLLSGSDLLDEDGDAHTFFRTPTTLDGQPAELSGVLGIHTHPTDDSEAPTGHLEVTVRTDQHPAERRDDTMDRLLRTYSELVGKSTFWIGGYWRFPKERAIFAIDLPIPLDPQEVAGFTEIRGVRLAQREDPEGPDLYSIILDKLKDGLSAQVSVEFDSQLDEDLISRGVKKVLEIANLVIEIVEKEDADTEAEDD